MRKSELVCNGALTKILGRLLWHPAWQAGYPVRFRVLSDIRTPTFRFNGRWLDVRLPPEYGRFIKTLAKLARQLRLAYSGNGKPKARKVAFKERTQPLSSTQPTNGNGRKPQTQPFLLSVTCPCGRTIELPKEWLPFARCNTCGSYLREALSEITAEAPDAT
jgi:hypothetical protein